MKYIKTFENLEGVKQIQFNKLAIFKFVSKIREIFKKYYNHDIKLVEEDPPHTFITAYKITTYGGIILKFFVPDSNYDLLKNIQVHIYDDQKEFYNFISNFLSGNKYKTMDTLNNISYYHNIFSLPFYELNEMSEKILDEFDLFTSINKYNL